ncbi:hypothetical protein HanIR_Chr16g0843451 [Helianthus annuus]|nr:hypothetical protein HanIR_Chr16g0843451 [Helianthus annuus]
MKEHHNWHYSCRALQSTHSTHMKVLKQLDEKKTKALMYMFRNCSKAMSSNQLDFDYRLRRSGYINYNANRDDYITNIDFTIYNDNNRTQ